MLSIRSLTWSRFVTTLLILYWVALTTATHVPQLPSGSMAYGDKFAHYIAYAGLAFLLSWAWTTRRPFYPKGILFAFGVAVAYGAVDELTQIPVPGRFGDWYDWIADSIGAMTGICLFWTLDAIRRFVFAHSRSPKQQAPRQ